MSPEAEKMAETLERWHGMLEAASLIRRQEARIRALEEALKPFARVADEFPHTEDDHPVIAGSDVTFGAFRRARAALEAI